MEKLVMLDVKDQHLKKTSAMALYALYIFYLQA